MTQSSRERWMGIILAAVLLLAGAASGVGGASGVAVANDPATVGDGDPTDEFDDATVDPITQCFAGEGYPLVIGDPPATIDSLVHLSVLTDPDNGGEFGVELAGTMEEERIVTLAAGVRLNRVGLLATGVNPFAAFDILYTYELRLPMFDGTVGETSYEEDEPPVSGAAGTVPC